MCDIHLGEEGSGWGTRGLWPQRRVWASALEHPQHTVELFFTQNKTEPVVKEFLSVLDIREEELRTFGSSREQFLSVLVSSSPKGAILTQCNCTKSSGITEFVYSNVRMETFSVSVFYKMSLFNLLFFESLKMPGNKYCTLAHHLLHISIVSSTFIMTFRISSLILLWQESLIGHCSEIQWSILPH